MNRVTPFLLVFALLAGFAAPTPTHSAAQSAVMLSKPNVIKGKGNYEDTVLVMGEVHNAGPEPVYAINIVATLLAGSGAVAGKKYDSLEFLGPGETCAFRIEFKNPAPHVRADVAVAFRKDSPDRYSSLTIGDGKISKKRDGFGDSFRLSATVTNGTGRPTTGNQVVNWYLDDQGNVVWVNNGLGVADLAPGAKDSFDLQTQDSSDFPAVSTITRTKAYAYGRLK